jgi:hypothetical protein
MTSTIMSKAPWQSKTLWFNLFALIAVVLDAATTAALPIVGSVYFVFAVIVVNALLRFLSTQPVTPTGGDPVEVDHAR